jgi:predicted nuclease with TOPRIM domain
MLYGGSSTKKGPYEQVEKEELQNERRNLKVTMNVVKDENIRLKTKITTLQQEMDKKDKDLENLTLRLQHSLNISNHHVSA